jgi:hypothetical protein
MKKSLNILAILLLVQSFSASEAFARRKDHKSSSKTVRTAIGTGTEDQVEFVSGCKLYVNGTEEKTLVNILGLIKFRSLEKCYQACGVVSFKDQTDYVLFDDEGSPISGTETQNIKREGFSVCGIQSCVTSDVVSSCQSQLQPYFDNCHANGSCGGYLGGQQGRAGNSNPYYQRPNLIDPEFPEVDLGAE